MRITCRISAVFTAAALIIFLFDSVRADDFNLITTISGDAQGDRFYHLARGHGDVNGDGYEDVLIGAPEAAPCGLAKLYFGGVEFDTIPDRIFQLNLNPYSEFGKGCAILEDINNDGYDDILGSSGKWIVEIF